ncbi:hypothetical protein Tco_0331556 [Tanacetum coccineum]
MSDLKFADTHNLVAILEKLTKSEGFEEIVDFLNANPIKYSLIVNPTIYCSCVKQFWDTIKAKTVNGEVQLQALVDKTKVIITESTIRRDLQLEDTNGVDCLPNAIIFEQLTLMGAKTTAWNEFSSTMASAIICLAINQKFNFSKYIFNSMVKNVDSMVKFYMYPSGPTKPMAYETENVESVPTHSNDPLLSGEDSLNSMKLKDTFLPRYKNDEVVWGVLEMHQTEGGDFLCMIFMVMRCTCVLDEQEVKVEKVVSTTEVTTKSAITTTVDELTLAQTLIEIKAAKPKNKGKAKMIESEKPLKKKDQIMYDQEVALNLQTQLQAELEEEERLTRQNEEEANIALIESWDNTQAMMDADYQMA